MRVGLRIGGQALGAVLGANWGRGVIKASAGPIALMTCVIMWRVMMTMK